MADKNDYKSIVESWNGLSIVESKDGYYGIVDEDFNVIVPIVYGYMDGLEVDGVVFASKHNAYEYTHHIDLRDRNNIKYIEDYYFGREEERPNKTV